MTTRLILIRHGETDDNFSQRVAGWRESRLTERGREQAERVARFVAERYQPVAIYASPLQRTRETADALARRAALPLRLEPALRELHFGDAEGLTLSELKERFAEVLRQSADEENEDVGWPNGEVRRDFYRRVRAAIDGIVRAHPGQTVAVVTHGGVVSAFLAAISEGRPTRWRSYESANCSVAEVIVSDGVHSIACWNLTDHLIDRGGGAGEEPS